MYILFIVVNLTFICNSYCCYFSAGIINLFFSCDHIPLCFIYFFFVLRYSADTLPGGFVSCVALLQHVHDSEDVAQKNEGWFETELQTACNCVPAL